MWMVPQEELFHFGVHLIRQIEVNDFDVVYALFFECFWHPEFCSLHLPVIQEAKQRLIILEHILGRVLTYIYFQFCFQQKKNVKI